MRHRNYLYALWALPLSAALATSPTTDDGTVSAAKQETTSIAIHSGDAPQSGAIRIYVDPKTGRWISNPSPEQRAELDRRISEDHNQQLRDPSTLPPMEQVTLPNGSVMLRFNGHMMSSVIARPGKDGHVVIECDDPLHDHAQDAANEQASQVDAETAAGLR